MPTLRRITSGEIAILRELSIQTFVDTFSAENTAENLSEYLETAFSEQQLLQEINTPGTEFYLVMQDDIACGYLKLNFGAAQSDLKESPGLEIERIYILKAALGTGIGAFMMNEAIHRAHGLGAPYLWLGVWEHNAHAIAFYHKYGFETFGSHVFRLGKDEQTDILMRRMVEIGRK